MKRFNIILSIIIILIIVGFSIFYIKGPIPSQPSVAIFNLVSHPILDNSIKGFKDGMSELGYVNGKNVKYLEINANGEMDKLNAFAKEIVNSKPSVIVPVSTPVTQAVFNVSPTSQQIVFSTVTNPSDVGMDKKPSNMTGVGDVVNFKANLELIKELFPSAKNLGIIYNAGERNSQFGVEQVRKLAPTLDLSIKEVAISSSNEIISAANILINKIDIFYVGSDNTVVSGISALLKVAINNKIPVVASDAGSVENGALAAVSVDYVTLGHEVANLVDKVLKGTPAGKIHNVMFLGDKLMINLKTASAIGYSFPVEVKNRADIIIE